MRIIFFNHYHNGDVFASKEYVRQIISLIPDADFIYQHYNSEKLLADIPITFYNLSESPVQIEDKITFAINGTDIFINTWIGNYLYPAPGINFVTYNAMFKKIFMWMSENGIASIPKRKASFYVPEIDFSYFNTQNITIPSNAILISNGPSLSGQSNTRGFDDLIERILKYTDYNLILTHQSSVSHKSRIFYTDSIIGVDGSDLNEISYVAEKCPIIIGKNSGPFCFTHTKNILSDESKKMIAVGNKKSDCFADGIRVGCNYVFVNDEHDDVTEKIMAEL